MVCTTDYATNVHDRCAIMPNSVCDWCMSLNREPRISPNVIRLSERKERRVGGSESTAIALSKEMKPLELELGSECSTSRFD
jgi:hypothetical protein